MGRVPDDAKTEKKRNWFTYCARETASRLRGAQDQMDEIQYASERDLAIRNVDRESALLRNVKAALRRIQDGSFGTCIECERAISPRRLGALPWASRCIRCQDNADRDWQERTESLSETLVAAA